MSRAAEITLMLLLIQGAIGFVDTIGMFDAHYMGDVSNNASYTITDLAAYSQTVDSGNPIPSDELLVAAHWIVEGFFLGIKIVWTMVFIFPMLVDKFHIPIELSVFIQIGIYFVYASFYSQYRTGKGWFQIKEI